jgi:membrane-associated HD superfamily phosphohydrolase
METERNESEKEKFVIINLEKLSDTVRKIEVSYPAVLYWFFLPLTLSIVSFSLARGWYDAVLLVLSFASNMLWLSLLLYIILLSIELYIVIKKVSLIGKITRQDALAVALYVFLIFLLSLIFALPLLPYLSQP